MSSAGVYLSEDPNTAALYAERVARGDEPLTVVTVVASILNPFVVQKTDWIRSSAGSAGRADATGLTPAPPG